MLIPKGTNVVLASYLGRSSIEGYDAISRGYRELYAGPLIEDFAYARGAVIAIDGPLGGRIPTREVELMPLLHGERPVGVEFVLPERKAGKTVPKLYVMMIQPDRSLPIDPKIAWPAHLEAAGVKAAMLAITYENRQSYDILALT